MTDSMSSFEAATFLKLSKSTLQRLTRQGMIQSWATPGGHRRFLMADLLAFQAQLGQRNQYEIKARHGVQVKCVRCREWVPARRVNAHREGCK